ncbi:MAG: hypothetical protein ABNH53_00940 [Henriciella sp.]|jgi:hypothetical protein
MSRLIIIRWLFACLALFAYAANGAQAHVMIHSGETLSLNMCGVTGQTVQLKIEGSAPEELTETCCGDCTMPAALSASGRVLLRGPMAQYVSFAAKARDEVSPRSPLWPGAPPQGPPLSITT